MHHRPRAPVAVVVVALVALAACQALPSASPAWSEVDAAHRRLATAFSTCDARAFVNAYAREFAFTTSNTPEAIRSTDGLKAYLAYGCGLVPNPTATVRRQVIRFVGAHAIATGQYLFRVPAGGKAVDLVQNYTATFVEEDGSWRIVAHHVSVAPR